MFNKFTCTQFCDWMHNMGITQEEAAGLLKVSLITIKEYAHDHVDIPPKVAAECWMILRTKTLRQRETS
jgi:plasmid maintenance system antidote protein VapI